MDKTKTVEQKVNTLLTKVDIIAKKEEVILKEVHQEEKQDTIQQKLVSKLQRHKLLFPLIVGIGVILVWRGLWELFDVTPIISYSFISLALGIVILWTINRINSL